MRKNSHRTKSQLAGLLTATGLLFTAAVCAGLGLGFGIGVPQAHADAVPDVECKQAAPADAPSAPPAHIPRREQLHQLATGARVKVAVIDTGVAPHEQLGPVEAGPDLVTPEEPNSLWDCDAHGTAVAGVIASRDTGVAPNAAILSIRQTSAHFRTREDTVTPDPNAQNTAGSLATVAAAIDAAVDAGAGVVNISVVSCIPAAAAEGLDTGVLDAALDRAEAEGVVVIAAAGNVGPGCEPGDVVFPAHSPTVLAVGAIDDAAPHQFADYSLPGPDSTRGSGRPGDPGAPESPGVLSATGQRPAALAPAANGWASGTVQPNTRGEVAGYVGTSFAAPIVTGTVALLKERHPNASAAQLRELIYQAAEPHTGFIDPYRAVTAQPADYTASARQEKLAAPAPLEPQAARRVGVLAATTFGVVFAVLVISALAPRSGKRGLGNRPARRARR